MTTTETDASLAKKIDTLDPDTMDLTDANVLANVLGYGADGDHESGGDGGEGETGQQPAAPAAEPAPAQAPAAPAAAAAAPAAVAAPAAPAGEGSPESSESPTAAASAEVKVDGVLTKDGKHVMPYSVVQQARRDALVQRERANELEAANRQLQEQLEALKNGTQAPGQAGYTQEQLDDIVRDFPQLAPFVNGVKQLQETVANLQPAKSKADPQRGIDDQLSIQEQIDNALAARPLLSTYRSKGGVVWDRAVEIDAEVLKAPDFASKSVAERFEEVEKRLADELGVPLAKPPAAPAPAAAPSAPATKPTSQAEALQKARETGPSTLSDISGAAPSVATDAWENRSAVEGLAAAEKLSDDGLLALAGLHY
jgi:hypothetical protein